MLRSKRRTGRPCVYLALGGAPRPGIMRWVIERSVLATVSLGEEPAMAATQEPGIAVPFHGFATHHLTLSTHFHGFYHLLCGETPAIKQPLEEEHTHSPSSLQ